MKPQRGMLFLLKDHDSSEKRRPIVVISNNVLNNGDSVVAVPFYSQQLEKRRTQDWCVEFYQGEGGLEKNCVAKTLN